MENLKIRVNSEDESKEAQELFFELGRVWHDTKCKTQMRYVEPVYYSSFDDMELACDVSDVNYKHKEITLPELRDLVVLKRNDVGDATHTDGHYSFYVGKDKNYFFSSCDKAWRGTWKNVDILKPIEKKEMKEYLRKNSNGTYSYIGPVHTDHVHDLMIEIPDGANFAWKSDGKYVFFTALEMGYRDASVVWSRHTHPEELPFIDDEPLLQTEIESEPDQVENLRELLTPYTPPLNNQYAEIEKVHQSHRTALEIADSALKYIRERAETYDQPTGERSAAKTAKAFNAITGKDITGSEVWLLLQLLKDVRQWSREDYHQDSAEDCIAYAALKAESLEGEK